MAGMTEKPINPYGRTGVVKAFQKGYGFIRDDESHKDIYVHRSHISKGRTRDNGDLYLREGDHVVFDVVEDRTGIHAGEVEISRKAED